MEFLKKIFQSFLKRKFTICVDAGHGGSDPGAINSIFKINEKDITFLVAKIVSTFLFESGFDVIMTREKDEFIDLSLRADFANASGADIFVSIHCNSVSDKTVTGIETHCYPKSKEGKNLALDLQESVMSQFPSHRDRGVKESDFQVLRDTIMPACLVELEFISNDEQATFLNSHESQNLMAEAIVAGIKKFFAL